MFGWGMQALPLPFNVKPLPHLQTQIPGVDNAIAIQLISAQRLRATSCVLLENNLMSVTFSFSFAKISMSLKNMEKFCYCFISSILLIQLCKINTQR